MADLIGLFDRDVFLKLGCCDLWEEALDCLGVTHPYRLASTTSAASTRRVLGRRLPPSVLGDACARVAAMVSTVPILPPEFQSGANAWPHLSGMLAEPDIGQDALLASIFFTMRGERVLVTGDKRFVSALRRQIPAEFSAAADRIVSFEACLLAITARYGLGHVMSRVREVAACDGSLLLAVGCSADTNEADFLTALRSYDPRGII